MHYFAEPNSIARRIWGSADTMLLVFAGAAAEFALNKTVDWLFFTGKIPHDPIGRLFSTARFAQEIMFADAEAARQTTDRINRIHRSVERQRDQTIPAWAHRDVLYLLMDYSERAFELLHRPLTAAERAELYDVNMRFGAMLGVQDLPPRYAAWQADRIAHLEQDLVFSDYTANLYAQYRKHLGPWRYNILLQTQALLVPERVRTLLKLPRPRQIVPVRVSYNLVTRLGLRPIMQRVLIQPQYLADVQRLDHPALA